MMRITFIILFLTLVSCDSNNEKEIAELFNRVSENRILGKKIAAIQDCEKIISIDKYNSDAYRVMSELTFEIGDFEKSLELNKKLIELNPNKYQYYSKTGLLLAVQDNEKDSELYYEKAREVFSKDEQKYWSKTDTLSMAYMLMNIGDSIRSRQLVKSALKSNPEDSSYAMAFKELNEYSHKRTINLLKKIMIESEYIEPTDNENSVIVEVEN